MTLFWCLHCLYYWRLYLSLEQISPMVSVLHCWLSISFYVTQIYLQTSAIFECENITVHISEYKYFYRLKSDYYSVWWFIATNFFFVFIVSKSFVTSAKMKFSIKDFLNKCDQIRHLNFKFCVVCLNTHSLAFLSFLWQFSSNSKENVLAKER